MTAPTSSTLTSFPNFYSSYATLRLFWLVFFVVFLANFPYKTLNVAFSSSMPPAFGKRRKRREFVYYLYIHVYSMCEVKWSVKTWMDYFTGTYIMISRRKFNFYTYFHFCMRIGRSSIRPPALTPLKLLLVCSLHFQL